MSYLYKNHSSEFIIEPTKYSKYYQLIIDKALSEQRVKLNKDHLDYIYYENHHILPKSLFPEFTKSKWNFVLLTAREHFIIHALIYKHFKSLNHHYQYKMGHAFSIMNNMGLYNSKMYKLYKIIRKNSSNTIEKMSKSSKKEITVNGIIYPSQSDAAFDLGITLSQFKWRRCKISDSVYSYEYIGDFSGIRKSVAKQKPIEINNIYYNSVSEAAELLGISRSTLYTTKKLNVNYIIT